MLSGHCFLATEVFHQGRNHRAEVFCAYKLTTSFHISAERVMYLELSTERVIFKSRVELNKPFD